MTINPEAQCDDCFPNSRSQHICSSRLENEGMRLARFSCSVGFCTNLIKTFSNSLKFLANCTCVILKNKLWKQTAWFVFFNALPRWRGFLRNFFVIPYWSCWTRKVELLLSYIGFVVIINGFFPCLKASKESHSWFSDMHRSDSTAHWKQTALVTLVWNWVRDASLWL